ncbi:MAG: hypothetical protein Q8M95_08055 [Candidatus Methanoperedens sp.]|nr:hypothetical protein [Candidatus Methanoperedens sp.]
MKERQIKAPRFASLQSRASGECRTRIGRISTDTPYPCASASSAQSVFYRTNAIFDDGNKPQIMAPRVTPLEGVYTYALRGIRGCGVENPQGFGIDERRYFPASDFRKIIHRKERKAQSMISFGLRKTTEGTEDTEKRNRTLCSLCSPWLNNLAGINYGGFDALALEYSIFTKGETIEGGTLA